jgi:divalent metal cation (Fe/Co/Zn/Cd) transporter
MLLRRGFALEYATLAWNVVGTVVLVLAAIASDSVALAGFGVDSLIEIVASAVVVWQLTGEAGAGRERRALRIIAIAFVLLAIYIAVQTAVTLSSRTHPGHSIVGIVWLAATVLVMFALAAGKRHTGERLGNPVLRTEARVTGIDGTLAAAVLAGVALNAAMGWWWADPLSALVILVYGVREAGHAWADAAQGDRQSDRASAAARTGHLRGLGSDRRHRP